MIFKTLFLIRYFSKDRETFLTRVTMIVVALVHEFIV